MDKSHPSHIRSPYDEGIRPLPNTSALTLKMNKCLIYDLRYELSRGV